MINQESSSVLSPNKKKFLWLRRVTRILVWCFLVPATVWSVAALYFDVRIPWLRVPLAAIYGLIIFMLWIKVRHPWKIIINVFCFVIVVGWWFSLRPSNERDWQPDVVKLPWAEIENNRVSIHNIRNCDYRTETDFDVRHYDKSFDLEKLRAVDLFLVYWGSPHMAHTIVSFGFENGDYVCMSIETRKEKSESYSAVKGLFRQFELTYIVADERDVVRLRTNYRKGEDAYLYRIQMTPEKGRVLLLNYLRRANSLRERPEWYNALTGNCTTAIRAQRAALDRAPWDWRMLVNGHLDELLYEKGVIPTNLPFAELRQNSYINPGARAADQSADFSRLIRQGLPGIMP